MLGVYDYTVVLTYVSLMVSVGGMMFAVNGHLHLGVMCLAISGLCDMKDRTDEKEPDRGGKAFWDPD